MSSGEIALVLVGLLAVVAAVILGTVYARSARNGRRYRPGRPFEFQPVWFGSSPRPGDRGAVVANAGRTAGAAVSGGPAGDGAARRGTTGGARDSW